TVFQMRLTLAVALLLPLIAGCTPYIPVRDDFGTSAATRSGKPIPPEYEEFNNYAPGVNRALAEQICTTPYHQLEDKTEGGQPGTIVHRRWRCETHTPTLGLW